MAMVQIDHSATGSTLQLAVGDQAELNLPETRTAGYSWKVVSRESPVFALEDSGFQKAPAVGGTGTHRWTVTARSKGSTELELSYARSWEAGAGKRFAMTITVE